MIRTQTSLATALLAIAAATHAGEIAGEFVAVNVPDDPDTLVRFTLDAVSAATPYHTTVGNFVRGLDLWDAHSGNYITTASSTSGTPVGIWEIVTEGETELLAPLGFETNSVGGLALHPSGDWFYVALDPGFVHPEDDGPLGTVLYEVDWEGTVTTIGEFHGDTAGGGNDIAGLAIHPFTEALYALSNESDAILIVNSDTAECSIVGNGLGFDAWSLGGMDFDDAGQLYILSTPDGVIHAVDHATGAAGPEIGRLGFVSSALTWIPAEINPCPADFDDDGYVSFNDLNILLDNWNDVVEPLNDGDADGDGHVSFNDLNSLLDQWAWVCD